MDAAFERAAEKIGADITAFVDAADRLVNLLSEEIAEMTPVAHTKHKIDVAAAMDAYDRARRALTGDDVSSA